MLFWTPLFSVLDSTFFVLDSTFWLDSTLKIDPIFVIDANAACFLYYTLIRLSLSQFFCRLLVNKTNRDFVGVPLIYTVYCSCSAWQWIGHTMNHLLGVYTFRSSDRPVGPTQATSDCLSDQSDRPVAQTVAEPPTSVNQINVACQLIIIPPTLQRDWLSDWPVGPTSRTQCPHASTVGSAVGRNQTCLILPTVCPTGRSDDRNSQRARM